jgi:hypothetical protein
MEYAKSSERPTQQRSSVPHSRGKCCNGLVRYQRWSGIRLVVGNRDSGLPIKPLGKFGGIWLIYPLTKNLLEVYPIAWGSILSENIHSSKNNNKVDSDPKLILIILQICDMINFMI